MESVQSPHGVQKVHPDRRTPGADLKSMDSGADESPPESMDSGRILRKSVCSPAESVRTFEKKYYAFCHCILLE